MAPARRQNYARSRSRSYNAPSYESAPPPPPNQDLMPPSSRYLHNLRVIQRHDPTITSLFDQFPHVCVYHHKGDEWKKKGCEGAMFLFEREEEPKYGFYILNRNNTGDYIQRMTPEDDVEFASAYLIYRAFGKVTSDTIGLWTMVTQDREAMSQVMMRLHSYIKLNARYPDEYRRRPDTWSTTPAPAHAQALPLPPSSLSTQVNPEATSMSALSVLLAKLGGSPDSPSNPSPPSRTVSASVPPPATGIPLLDSIFASASASPAETTPQEESPNVNVFHALFANGVTANGAVANGSSSRSTSCGPTPTQHISELPTSSSPSRASARPLLNGSQSSPAGRSVLPHPRPHARNGRETAPPVARHALASQHPKSGKVTANDVGGSGVRRHPDKHVGVPDQGDEEEWEEEAVASVSAGMDEGEADPQPSSRRNKARKAKKRERERERRRLLKHGVPQDATVVASVEEVEWPLVDDRSLSMDDEVEEGDSVGLGDGLLNALAAVSEPDLPNEVGQEQRQGSASKKRNKERGKDRWKRRQREDAAASAQARSLSVDPDMSPQHPDMSVGAGPTSHSTEVRNALLDTYGSRRRVGDGVLDEEALAKEVVELIHNDPTFVRELHEQYLRRVQV